MALRKKLIQIPLGAVPTKNGMMSKAIDQTQSDIISNSPILKVADNVTFSKDNLLQKRNGFTGYTNTGIDPGTTYYTIDSVNGQLFIQTSTGNYIWSESLYHWEKTTTSGPRLKSYESKIISNGSGSFSFVDQDLHTSHLATVAVESVFIDRNIGSIANILPELNNITFTVEDITTKNIIYRRTLLAAADNPSYCKVSAIKPSIFVISYVNFANGTTGNDELKAFTVDISTGVISSTVTITGHLNDITRYALWSDDTYIYFGVDNKIIKTTLSLTIAASQIVPADVVDIIDIDTNNCMCAYYDITTNIMWAVLFDKNTLALATSYPIGLSGEAINGNLVFESVNKIYFTGHTSVGTPIVYLLDGNGATVQSYGLYPNGYMCAQGYFHTILNSVVIPVCTWKGPASLGSFIFTNGSLAVPGPVVAGKGSYGIYKTRARFGLDEITQYNPYLVTSNSPPGLKLIPLAKSIYYNAISYIATVSTTNEQAMGWYYALGTEDPLELKRTQIKRYELETGSSPSRLVELGGLSYRANGSLICFDGRSEFESTIPFAPETYYTNGSGTDFWIKTIYSFIDGKGNVHRSTPSDPFAISKQNTSGTGPALVGITVPYALDPVEFGDMNVSIEFYISSTEFGTYYFWGRLIPEIDPNHTAYSWWSSFDGNIVSMLGPATTTGIVYTGNTLYNTGNVLDSEPLPNVKSVDSFNSRLFVIDADKQWKIWYSKKIVDKVSAEFNSLAVINLPEAELSATSIFPVGNRLVISTADELYWTAGDGPNVIGAGNAFPTPKLLSTDTGVLEDGSVITGDFGVVFLGKAGFYLLSPNLQLKYIGKEVEDLLGSSTILSSVLMPVKKECRWVLSNGTVIIWNYRLNTWTRYNNQLSPINATNHNDEFTFIASGGNFIYKEDSTVYHDDGLSIDEAGIQTSWIKLNTVQGYQRIKRVMLTGHHDSGELKVILGFNYDSSVPAETHTWTEAELIALRNGSGNFSVNVHVKNQKCESIAVFIGNTDPFQADTKNYGAGIQMSSIVLEAAVKAGRYKTSKDNTK